MELIFDTHAHYDDAAFQEDREEILSGLSEHGVGYVVDVSAGQFCEMFYFKVSIPLRAQTEKTIWFGAQP